MSRSPKTSCASAAWRCATGCSSTGPTHWAAAVRTGAGEIEVASGRKPRLRARRRLPGVRGVARLGEAFAVIPLVKRALPEARLPFQDPRRARRRRRRVARRHARCAAACAAPAARRRRRWSASCRRCSRCAAASSPPTTASSTRRSAPTRPSRRRGRRRQGARPLRLAPRGADARRPTSRARCCSARRRAPGPARRRRRRAGLDGRGRRGLRLVRAPRARRAPARALRRPGFELQRLVGTREPDERQLEVGRAALAEILRAERHAKQSAD